MTQTDNFLLAQDAAEAFRADLVQYQADPTVSFAAVESTVPDSHDRHIFNFTGDKIGAHTIAFPGLPIEKIRYVASDGRSGEYPRLSFDGHDLVWKYALRASTKEGYVPPPEPTQLDRIESMLGVIGLMLTHALGHICPGHPE